jgi:hypothetical protein
MHHRSALLSRTLAHVIDGLRSATGSYPRLWNATHNLDLTWTLGRPCLKATPLAGAPFLGLQWGPAWRDDACGSPAERRGTLDPETRWLILTPSPSVTVHHHKYHSGQAFHWAGELGTTATKCDRAGRTVTRKWHQKWHRKECARDPPGQPAIPRPAVSVNMIGRTAPVDRSPRGAGFHHPAPRDSRTLGRSHRGDWCAPTDPADWLLDRPN